MNVPERHDGHEPNKLVCVCADRCCLKAVVAAEESTEELRMACAIIFVYHPGYPMHSCKVTTSSPSPASALQARTGLHRCIQKGH
jgi:hypothetical protein